MPPLTDPNQVRMTGENQYMRLHESEQGPMTTRCSHWRVLFSPAGSGHALFLRSDVTDDDVRIYTDQVDVARWLQQEILTTGEFSDRSIPTLEARFARLGDTHTYWTETIETAEEHLLLTWTDFIEPFVINVPVGSTPERPLGWSSVFVPARSVRLSLNGKMATGKAFPELRGERQSSTAGLALSETWVRPY